MNRDTNGAPLDEFDKERTYLEGLLATRINFYLIFVSFYFVAVFGADVVNVSPTQRAAALAFGGLVSLFMALSVQRTTALVEHILRCFRDKHLNHPYTSAHKHLEKSWLKSISANCYIALVPWGFTVAFFVLAFLAGCASWLPP